MELTGERHKTQDIVFTCPPMNLYEWDYEIYKEKGIGGSETALVEMAHHMKQKSGRRVLVFHTRKEPKVINGVEYLRIEDMFKYFDAFEPALHISWRHSTKITKAPTYIWSHDLITPDCEKVMNYNKVFCLSDFHKQYLHSMTGVALDKIHVTRNGLDPDRFKDLVIEKERGKIIYSSSPDRGLKQTILTMDEIVKDVPEAKLHIYYGFSNMEKFGLHDQVNELKEMIDQREHVVFHGNLAQKDLVKEFASAEVWLYPTNFLETYCITAIECLACKVYPVVRGIGALPDTLKDAAANNMADVLDETYETHEGIKKYADHAVAAIREKKWQNINIDVSSLSWESPAGS
jgi:glycosyltransferase involved in cell wall biosynthesis